MRGLEIIRYLCTRMIRLLLLSLYLLLAFSLQAKDEIVSFKLSSQNGLPDNSVRYIQQAPTGELLLMMHYAAYSFDGYTYRRLPQEEFERLKAASLKDHSLSVGHNRDNMGNHVVMEGNAIVYTDHATGEQIRLQVLDPQWGKLTQNLKCRVVTDHEGRIWVSINGFGLYVYNRRTEQLRHISEDDGSGLIDTNYLVYMMLDRDDHVWVAGEHYGLFCLQTVNQGYEVVLPSGQTDKERTEEIRMMSRLSNGRIILANNAGVVMTADSLLENIVPLSTDGENYISACLDGVGRLWLGSRVNGVNVDGRHYSQGRIDCLLLDSKGRMWACGLKRAVSMMTIDDEGRFHERGFFEDSVGLQARMMIEDHRGDIWLASEKGLFVFNPNELLADSKAYKKILDEPIRCLCQDSRGVLWAGTLAGGVLHGDNSAWHPTAFTRLDRSDGLVGDAVQMIAEDGHHNICIATQTGCSVYQQETGLIWTLYITDHQLRNYYEENSQALLGNGRLALGTLDGIVVLHDHNLTAEERPHAVTITSIFVNGEEGQLPMEGSWEGSHTENTLTFHVSNYNYPELRQTDYTFFLEGYDREWSVPGHQNQTSYKNLPPGHYTLRVKAREMGGQWGGETTLAVVVNPPLWATWRAYLIYIITTIVVGYTLYRHLRHLNALRQAVAVEKQLTEYKLKFFTNISHEFRTPLTLIQGSMDKLKSLPDVPSSTRAPLSNMQRNVDRMLRLINQLLEFRRMQNNKLSLALEETDIVSFVYNLCQSFHDTADQKHIALTFVPAMKNYTMFIDRGFIDKAVYNLLSNAFKYTPKGGSVTVRVREAGTNMSIIVEDTGVGVPENMREKIFDRFQRGQLGRDSLGIGLDLTAELIRTHHGSIRCDANPNGGSIFTIKLPTDKNIYEEKDFLSSEAPQQAEQDDDRKGFTELVREATPEPMNDHCILIVEDDADIAAFLKQELSRYFQTETAADGEEALTLLHSSPSTFSLVITDAMMPRMNGFELIRRLRRDEPTRHLPVIMLTALDAQEQQLKGMEAGADAYITKPFSVPLLLLYCRNLIQRSDNLRKETEKQQADNNPVDADSQKKKAMAVAQVIMEERDQKLLAQLSVWVESHLAAPDLSVDKFAEDMGYGRTSFYIKLKALTGMTPNEYIKERRLQKAYEMLKDERVTVAEVAYQVGMGTPQYLSTTFKKRFGITPTQYQKGKVS